MVFELFGAVFLCIWCGNGSHQSRMKIRPTKRPGFMSLQTLKLVYPEAQ